MSVFIPLSVALLGLFFVLLLMLAWDRENPSWHQKSLGWKDREEKR